MVADVSIDKECFINISDILNQFKEFSILSPTYFDESIYKNYTINNKEIATLKNKQISNFILSVNQRKAYETSRQSR